MSAPVSYWNGTGTHQALYEALCARIVNIDFATDARRYPALNRLRKAANAYYDLCNNGGGNRPQAIVATFGKGVIGLARKGYSAAMHESVEPTMDRLILDAARECEATALAAASRARTAS